jgi:hypothetical protein
MKKKTIKFSKLGINLAFSIQGIEGVKVKIDEHRYVNVGTSGAVCLSKEETKTLKTISA